KTVSRGVTTRMTTAIPRAIQRSERHQRIREWFPLFTARVPSDGVRSVRRGSRLAVTLPSFAGKSTPVYGTSRGTAPVAPRGCRASLEASLENEEGAWLGNLHRVPSPRAAEMNPVGGRGIHDVGPDMQRPSIARHCLVLDEVNP